MVKSKNISSHKKLNSKIIPYMKSLSLISPFSFSEKNSFVYNIKFYKLFKRFSNSFNKYKLSEEEIYFLKTNITNIEESFKILDSKYNNNIPIDYFQKLFKYIQPIEEYQNRIKDKIENIMKNRKKQENISLLKIKEILKNEYNIIISKTTIHRILRNKLKYKFRKTVVKNKDLDNLKYKIISFIFIKIIIRAMKLNMNFVFIDESNFSLVNNHYKTWINNDENFHYGPKSKKKLNIILAVSTNSVINYEITKDNINQNNFGNFLEKTIDKMEINELNNAIFIMDNLSVHCSKEVFDKMSKRNIKVLFTVPYESSFNAIELCFRYIKNKTYKKIYLNIKDLRKDVIKILENKSIEEVLFKNFIETLRKYLIFVEKNKFINLDKIQ